MVKIHPRSFRFGAMVEEDHAALALFLIDLEDHLNKHIDLSKYTDRVEKIYFVPVFLPSADENREEEFRYDEAERTIFLRVELDPEQLAGIGKEDFLKYVIHAFIGELEKLEVLPERLMEKIGQVLFQNEQD